MFHLPPRLNLPPLLLILILLQIGPGLIIRDKGPLGIMLLWKTLVIGPIVLSYTVRSSLLNIYLVNKQIQQGSIYDYSSGKNYYYLRGR